jgi:hypothetical protein
MNARRSTSATEVGAPPPVQAPPPAIGLGQGHPEYHFVVGLMDVKGQLGEISASLQALSKTVDSMKADVKDLTALKHKMTGAVIVLGIVGTLVVAILSFVAKVAYDFAMKPVPVVATITAASPLAPPPERNQPKARTRAQSQPLSNAPVVTPQQ